MWKTTLIESLRKVYDDKTFLDRGILTKLTDVYPDDWPENINKDGIQI